MSATEAVSIARELPGIGTLEFVESDKRREYWLLPEGGQRRTRLPSVTSVLRDTWPKPQLLEWYAREGANASAVLANASRRGKAVHKFLETFLTTGELLPWDVFPRDFRPFLEGAARFIWTYDPKPVAVERLVCHPEHRYAGRLDLLAGVEGALTLVDYKSNPKGVVYPEAHVQAAAYSIADHRCGGEPVERVLLIGLGEDGSMHPVEGNVSEAKKVWGSALDFYTQIGRLKRALA
jgi:hypothetical protein